MWPWVCGILGGRINMVFGCVWFQNLCQFRMPTVQWTVSWCLMMVFGRWKKDIVPKNIYSDRLLHCWKSLPDMKRSHCVAIDLFLQSSMVPATRLFLQVVRVRRPGEENVKGENLQMEENGKNMERYENAVKHGETWWNLAKFQTSEHDEMGQVMPSDWVRGPPAASLDAEALALC